MTYKSLNVSDAFINTTIYDDSAVVVPDVILPKRLTILQPIFASKGKANEILDFNSSSLVQSVYGADMTDIKKFGQGGLNLIHGMGGGASAQVCRLLPDNATTAALLVKLELKEGEEITRTIEDKTVTTKEIESKIVFDKTADATSVVDGKITVNEGVHTIPLFKVVYNGAGKCGNNIGISISNDYERDDAVTDGRRYIIKIYEKDDNGNSSDTGIQFFFSLNPDARLMEGSSVYENLQYVFTDKDTSGTERAYKCKSYIMDNYEYLENLIAKACPSTVSPKDIDILSLTNKSGVSYFKYDTAEAKYTYGAEEPTIHFDATAERLQSIGSDAIYWLGGGSDGDLQLGYTYTKLIEGVPTTITVDEAKVKSTKNTLLCNFFKGQIDPAIFDERMIYSDIVFDADYDIAADSVKQTMLGKFRDIRPDIMVIADIGTTAKTCTQAMNLAKNVYGMVDGSAGYSAAVIVHAGYTTDRALNVHVTGTYDYAYGLAKCYGLLGTFSVFAGYQVAKVTTMEYDWLPYKDENDTMLTPLRKLGCIFATKIDRAGTVAYMSEENMYTQTTSRLKSIRNGMVIGDAVRLAKSVLIKYVYDNDGAAGAIRKSSAELAERLSGRYPSNITVAANLYQSERDKLLDTSTCDLTYYFPGMTKGWTLNIYAKRGA